MFTGIVEKKAKVTAVKKTGGGTKLLIPAPAGWARLPLGSSIAVDGACLTVSALVGAHGRAPLLAFDLLRETLRRTRFSSLQPGDTVNMERSLKSGKRIDGHVVQGHVDGTGKVMKVLSHQKEKSILIAYPKALKKYIIPKGSIAVNGVSLTCGKIKKNTFWVHVIPHTLKKTNLDLLALGHRVNLETDALFKFWHSTKRP